MLYPTKLKSIVGQYRGEVPELEHGRKGETAKGSAVIVGEAQEGRGNEWVRNKAAKLSMRPG